MTIKRTRVPSRRLLASTLVLLALISTPADLAAQDEIEIVSTGDTSCAWGGRDCNRCVVDVEAQFQRLKPQPTGLFTYWSGAGRQLVGMDAPMLPLSLPKLSGGSERNKGHIQGFNRIPGLAENNWVVSSLSTKKKDHPGRPAGLLIAQVIDAPAEHAASESGFPLAPAGDADRFWVANQGPAGPTPPELRASRLFHKIEATKHPGGFQSIGRIVAVANYCNGPARDQCKVPKREAFVDFIELGEDPNASGLVTATRIGRLFLGDIGWGPWKQRKKAFYLAIARMADKRYVLMVNRSDLEHQQFFVSSNTTIDESTEWLEWGVRDFKSPTYQNMSFVTDCASGHLYLIGYKQKPKWAADNRVDLYRFHSDHPHPLIDVGIERLFDVTIAEADDTCESKGGSGVYVTPGGRMVVYCSQGRSLDYRRYGSWEFGARDDQDVRLLNFSEFAADALPGCGDGVRQPTEECDDGNLFEGRCRASGAACDNPGGTCADGSACDYDGCSSFCGVTATPPGDECREHADCAAGFSCRNGFCVENIG